MTILHLPLLDLSMATTAMAEATDVSLWESQKVDRGVVVMVAMVWCWALETNTDEQLPPHRAQVRHASS